MFIDNSREIDPVHMTAHCSNCNSTGRIAEEGFDGHWSFMFTCGLCTAEIGMCIRCDAAPNACDDLCIDCQSELFRENPAELERDWSFDKAFSEAARKAREAA